MNPANFWLLFGGLWLGVGSLFAAVGGLVLWQETGRAERLAQGGERATAMLLAKQPQKSALRIEYRFTTAAGTVVEGTARVDEPRWRARAEGETFELRYLPDAPEVQRVPDQHRDEEALGPIFTAVGSLFAIAGGLILWRFSARRALIERLRVEGMRADAEVIEVGPTNFRMNREPMWAIRYRFRDHVGNVHVGKTPPMAQEEARAWQPGARGEVRFETARPQRHVWLGKG